MSEMLCVIALTFVNLAVLALNLKLYTEIMKEKAQRPR